MEQSMAYYHNPNIPLHLNAVTLHEFKYNKEILRLNIRITDLL